MRGLQFVRHDPPSPKGTAGRREVPGWWGDRAGWRCSAQYQRRLVHFRPSEMLPSGCKPPRNVRIPSGRLETGLSKERFGNGSDAGAVKENGRHSGQLSDSDRASTALPVRGRSGKGVAGDGNPTPSARLCASAICRGMHSVKQEVAKYFNRLATVAWPLLDGCPS